MTEKKVVGSKNDITKSCQKFYKLGDNFFYFDKIWKKGAKNHRAKKVIKSNNDKNKSCPKFCKLGDIFFYFDKISKMKILEPKNAFL